MVKCRKLTTKDHQMAMHQMLKQLQEALELSDADMASYLNISLSQLREAKSPTGQELSAHAAFDVLNHFGFVKLTDKTLLLIPKRAREKLVEARTRRALTIAQQNAIKKLAKAKDLDS